MADNTNNNTLKLIGLGGIFTLAFLGPVAFAVLNDDEDTPTQNTTTATQPVETLTAAKPTTTLQKPDECTTPTQQHINDLLDTLKQPGGTAELSASWIDSDTHTEATALMVRSAAGTIDQPHLVWVNVNDEWQAATAGTQQATNSPPADSETRAGSAVSGAITCLTAGSR